MEPVEFTNATELKAQLRHVLFIGGPPDSGKTTIADALAEQHGLQVYHFDRHEMEHFSRADAVRHPALYGSHPDRVTTEERWLGSSPERDGRGDDRLLERTLRHGTSKTFWPCRTRRTSLPRVRASSPSCCRHYWPIPIQAIWLVPSPAFKVTSSIRRDKPGSRWETTDPDLAQRNLIERDLIMGKYVHDSARELGLQVYEVDGSRSLEQVRADIEQFFGSLLER